MKTIAIAGWVLILAGCGGDAAPTISAHVRVDSLLADDVASLSIFVFEPWRTDDVMLTCGNLLERIVLPTDTKVKELAREDVTLSALSGTTFVLDGVDAGTHRLVYVEAFDASEQLIANGCAEGVTVTSGKTVSVDVRVDRIN